MTTLSLTWNFWSLQIVDRNLKKISCPTTTLNFKEKILNFKRSKEDTPSCESSPQWVSEYSNEFYRPLCREQCLCSVQSCWKHTKKLKQSNANNMCSFGCSKKLELLLCKKTQQVQLFPFVPLTHLGFHANEDSIVFSSTSPDGRIRLKGK